MVITRKNLTSFREHLREQDRSDNTVEKYTRDAAKLVEFAEGRKLTRGLLAEFRKALSEAYAATSANSMIAAVNAFFEFLGKRDYRLRPLKIQRTVFASEEKELEREDYGKLIAAANKNPRLSLIVQTICSTGIRVSELKFITAESAASGRAEINCKGKHRTVFLPESLRGLLREYCAKRGITSGSVFVTRTGRPLDRSNIWREMKKLSEPARVAKKKVFPHNLRHLFARTYYSQEKDLARLADILGHSSIETTRIYTKESGHIHARQIERLNLVLTT